MTKSHAEDWTEDTAGALERELKVVKTRIAYLRDSDGSTMDIRDLMGVHAAVENAIHEIRMVQAGLR